MLELAVPSSGKRRLCVLCLGAHADDIEIGCGAFLLELIRSRPATEVHWVVFSASGPRQREARRGADLFLDGSAHSRVILKQFRDGFFPSQFAPIKRVFEQLKRTVTPDLVLTHYRDDRHQDHRVLSDLAWNTWRDHLILEYEIPKYDGDLGTPNLFVPIARDICDRKLALLETVFATQRDKHWFDRETFRGLMRLRGMECRSKSGYAEAFYTRKSTLRI